VAVALILVARMAQAGVADDQTSRDDAQKSLEEGNRLFRGGEYGEALRMYREARERFPSPKLLFNLARCEDQLDERASAVGHYARFLKDVPDANDEFRVEADTRMKALMDEIVEISLVSVPLGARVAVDGRVAELSPPGGSIWAEPGEHQLSVTGPAGESWTVPIEGKAGAKLSVSVPSLLVFGGSKGARVPSVSGDISVESKHMNSSSLPSASPRPLFRRWWFWAAVGAVLVSAGVILFTATRPSCPADRCVAPWGS
jgi:hypothetical protein